MWLTSNEHSFLKKFLENTPKQLIKIVLVAMLKEMRKSPKNRINLMYIKDVIMGMVLEPKPEGE